VPVRSTPASHLSRQAPATQQRLIEEATKALSDESVKTKESVLTVVATYLSNKEDKWWMQPAEFREREVYFVIKMLVHTFNTLEEK
jgi:hypothetical protein